MTVALDPARTGPNRYRDLCLDAADDARHAVAALTSSGPHPMDGALRTLQGAWISPSPQRYQFEATLLDLSHRLLAGFTTTADELDHAVAREPVTVDLDNPAEAWKARVHTTRSAMY